nr:translocating chain-associated membrane protein 2 isoform X1 [Anas platyrhynchos]
MAFRRRAKSHPLFSQEFLIHNHADIGFCLVLIVFIALMFEVTAKTAFLFILPQYNVSVPTADGELVQYHYGLKDLVTILFYIFIAIILHAVVQEYALDKINRRLHLSKVKHSKFNESGQLVAFHLTSLIWCLYVVVTEGYISNPRSLWENYPHVYLPFQVKFFYLCQLAYWLHALPELYFQKVRKEDIPRQLQCIALYLAHIAGAYLLNLSRLGLILLLLQYLAEFFFHMARLVYFTDENNEKLFNVWAVVFVVTRLFTLTLYILVIGFGLPRVENQALEPEKGNLFSFLFNNILFSLPLLRPCQNECAAVGVPLPGLGDVALHPLPAAALAGVLARAEQSEASRRRHRRRQAASQASQEGLGLPRKRSGEGGERHLAANQEAEVAVRSEGSSWGGGRDTRTMGPARPPGPRERLAHTGHPPKVSLALLPAFLALSNRLQ